MKHVVLHEDQQIMRDVASRFVREHYGFERREEIRASADGFDDAAWKRFADLGWLSLPFPEALGGVGATLLDVALLAEILGPALVAEPYIPTIACGVAILGGDDRRRRELIPALCAGRLRLALAVTERASGYDHTSPATEAIPHGEGFRITGAKAVVVGAPVADQLLVSASAPGDPGLSLFLIPSDAPDVSMRPYATVDGQRAAEVKLDGVEVGAEALVGPRGLGLPILQRAIDAGTVALLGEAAGLVQAALDVTAQYLDTREQFGRKLASFQALRHRVARMYVGKEEVRALCRQAAAAYADDPDGVDTREAIAAAKVHVGRVGRHVCEEAIQLHGAIAIADEYVVGHFLKRMVAIDHMFGNANHHFDVYVATSRSLAARAG